MLKRPRLRAVLFVCLVSYLFTDVVLAQQKVRLRAVKGPIGEWHRSLSGLTLARATATVKNISSTSATGIEVLLKIPGGGEVKMDGPDTLEKYEQAEYTLSKEQTAKGGSRLWIKFVCDNCRR